MKEEMHQSEDNKHIPMISVSSGKAREITNDVYLTTNWEMARESVQNLAALKPNFVITGDLFEMKESI